MDYPAAEEFRDTVAATIIHADVLVTLDYAEACAAVSNGTVTVYIPAPRTEFPTHFAADTTYTLLFVTGSDDPMVTWAATTALVPKLVHTLGASELEPSAFQPTHGPILPAFTLTIPMSYDI